MARTLAQITKKGEAKRKAMGKAFSYGNGDYYIINGWEEGDAIVEIYDSGHNLKSLNSLIDPNNHYEDKHMPEFDRYPDYLCRLKNIGRKIVQKLKNCI